MSPWTTAPVSSGQYSPGFHTWSVLWAGDGVSANKRDSCPFYLHMSWLKPCEDVTCQGSQQCWTQGWISDFRRCYLFYLFVKQKQTVPIGWFLTQCPQLLGYTRSKAGAKNSVWLLQVGGTASSTGAVTCSLSGCALTENWNQEWSQNSDLGTPGEKASVPNNTLVICQMLSTNLGS